MFFDEVPENYSFKTPTKPITGTEVDLAAQLSGMDLPAFLDDEAAQKWGFKKRVVPGAYLLCCVIGLLAKQGFLADAVWINSEVAFKSTVHPGDTVYVDNQVISKTENKKRNCGFVTYKWALKNQHDVVLAEGTNT